jgi:hypothetical protein
MTGEVAPLVLSELHFCKRVYRNLIHLSLSGGSPSIPTERDRLDREQLHRKYDDLLSENSVVRGESLGFLALLVSRLGLCTLCGFLLSFDLLQSEDLFTFLFLEFLLDVLLILP